MPGLDQLDGLHEAAAADVADAGVVGDFMASSRVAEGGAELLGPADEAAALDQVDGGDRGRARHRVAAVGAAQAADVHGVHDARPGR